MTHVPVPNYETPTLAWAVLDETISQLGIGRDERATTPVTILVSRAVIAWYATFQTVYPVVNGNTRAKTKKQREAEALVADTLFGVLADWQGAPVGVNKFDVEQHISRAYDNAMEQVVGSL